MIRAPVNCSTSNNIAQRQILAQAFASSLMHNVPCIGRARLESEEGLRSNSGRTPRWREWKSSYSCWSSIETGSCLSLVDHLCEVVYLRCQINIHASEGVHWEQLDSSARVMLVLNVCVNVFKKLGDQNHGSHYGLWNLLTHAQALSVAIANRWLHCVNYKLTQIYFPKGYRLYTLAYGCSEVRDRLEDTCISLQNDLERVLIMNKSISTTCSTCVYYNHLSCIVHYRMADIAGGRKLFQGASKGPRHFVQAGEWNSTLDLGRRVFWLCVYRNKVDGDSGSHFCWFAMSSIMLCL